MINSRIVKSVLVNKKSNEKFIIGTYINLEVLIRESDGYVNASRLCKSIGKKEFHRIRDNAGFTEFENEIQVVLKSGTPLKYVLSSGFDNELKGRYVHPKLVNYIAMWASPKFAVYVSEIMDSINTIGQLTNNQNYSDEHLQEMKNKITEMEQDLKDKEEIIQTQDSTIDQLMNQTSELQVDQYENSVRSKNVNNKYLFIMKFKYENIDQIYYYLSYNQSLIKKDHHNKFKFPSAMNIKQELDIFIKKMYSAYN